MVIKSGSNVVEILLRPFNLSSSYKSCFHPKKFVKLKNDTCNFLMLILILIFYLKFSVILIYKLIEKIKILQ